MISLPDKITDYHYSLEYISLLIGRTLTYCKGHVIINDIGGWIIGEISNIVYYDNSNKVAAVRFRLKDSPNTLSLQAHECIELIHGDESHDAFGWKTLLKPKEMDEEKNINDLLPICQDFTGDYKKEGIWRINLAGMTKHSPTGNFGYMPFLKRYKTKEEAQSVREEIFKVIQLNF